MFAGFCSMKTKFELLYLNKKVVGRLTRNFKKLGMTVQFYCAREVLKNIDVASVLILIFFSQLCEFNVDKINH